MRRIIHCFNSFCFASRENSQDPIIFSTKGATILHPSPSGWGSHQRGIRPVGPEWFCPNRIAAFQAAALFRWESSPLGWAQRFCTFGANENLRTPDHSLM